MKRRLQIVGIVGAVIVAAVIALPFGANVNSFRPKLETELSAAIGRPVRVGNLSLSFFARTVSAQDVTIGDEPQTQNKSVMKNFKDLFHRKNKN